MSDEILLLTSYKRNQKKKKMKTFLEALVYSSNLSHTHTQVATCSSPYELTSSSFVTFSSQKNNIRTQPETLNTKKKVHTLHNLHQQC